MSSMALNIRSAPVVGWFPLFFPLLKHLNELSCLCLSHTEQLLQQQPAWFQKWTFNLSVVESIRLARADSKSSILMLLDLSIAFDTVNHQILMSTLLVKGISGTALQWFVSYLTDRSVKVSWRGEVSKSQHLATGGPLGLISFTL